MITVLYASRSVSDMDLGALVELLRVGRDRNAAGDVTGMLVYAYGSFMQQLEGEPEAVDPIYASIAADPRHRDLRLLDRREITTRRFPRWAMGFDHPDAERLSRSLPGFHRDVRHPLVNADLVTNAELAENLLGLLAAQAVDPGTAPGGDSARGDQVSAR